MFCPSMINPTTDIGLEHGSTRTVVALLLLLLLLAILEHLTFLDSGLYQLDPGVVGMAGDCTAYSRLKRLHLRGSGTITVSVDKNACKS